jgi:hypothetical protein
MAATPLKVDEASELLPFHFLPMYLEPIRTLVVLGIPG